MSSDKNREKDTTRRGFVKKVGAGAGSLAIASALREALGPNQSGLVAAPADTQSADGTVYGKYFLKDDGEPPKAGDFVGLNSIGRRRCRIIGSGGGGLGRSTLSCSGLICCGCGLITGCIGVGHCRAGKAYQHKHTQHEHKIFSFHFPCSLHFLLLNFIKLCEIAITLNFLHPFVP